MARATKRLERRLEKLEDIVDRIARNARKQKKSKGESLSHLHDHIQRIESKLKVAGGRKRAS